MAIRGPAHSHFNTHYHQLQAWVLFQQMPLFIIDVINSQLCEIEKWDLYAGIPIYTNHVMPTSSRILNFKLIIEEHGKW